MSGDGDRGESQRLAGLDLPGRDRLQAASNDLGDVGAGEEGEHEDRTRNRPRNVRVGWEQKADGELAHEEQADEGHAAHEFDVADRQWPDQREGRPTGRKLLRTAWEGVRWMAVT